MEKHKFTLEHTEVVIKKNEIEKEYSIPNHVFYFKFGQIYVKYNVPKITSDKNKAIEFVLIEPYVPMIRKETLHFKDIPSLYDSANCTYLNVFAQLLVDNKFEVISKKEYEDEFNKHVNNLK